jgi:site-specific recombinase XerD
MVIAKYILSMRIETSLSDNHRRDIITSLKLLSETLNNKPFTEMTRENILQYLDSLRKSDNDDRLHRWVSTYNHRRIAFLRFFKWLYHPDNEASNREKPQVVKNIPEIREGKNLSINLLIYGQKKICDFSKILYEQKGQVLSRNGSRHEL